MPRSMLPQREVLGYLRGANEYNHNFYTPLPINKDFRIGSSPKCDIVIDLDYISPFHCVIRAEVEEIGYVRVYLTDLSTNGTYLNGELIGFNQTVILYPAGIISFVSQHLNLYYIPVYKKDINNRVENTEYEEEFLVPLYPEGHKNQCMISVTRRAIGFGNQSTILLCNVEKRIRVQLAVKERNQSRIWGPGKALQTELNILKNNKHQNVLSAINSFEKNYKSYSFTPLYYGGSLAQRIYKPYPIEEKDAFFIFSQILSGLTYLHKKGIIHCDLKPDNILLANDVKRTRVVIADFGLAIESKEVNDWPNEHGTLAYQAPEILIKETFEKKPFDEKVDIWALGIILFEMFAKKHPFYQEVEDQYTAIHATRQNILTKEPDTGSLISASAEAKVLIDTLLSKDPTTRSLDKSYANWALVYADDYFYQEILQVHKDFIRERYMWFGDVEMGAEEMPLRPMYHPDRDEAATRRMTSRMKVPLDDPNYLFKINRKFAEVEVDGHDHIMFLNEERYPIRTLLKKRLDGFSSSDESLDSSSP